MTQISPIGVEKDNVTTFEVEVSIDNPGKELKANMTANAEIVLEQFPNSLLVPEAAVTYDAQKQCLRRRGRSRREDRPAARAGQGRRRQRHAHAGARAASRRATRSSSRVSHASKSWRRSLSNLRANKLRSFLTMFGILWGVISVVILSATGEGFQRGNQHVLEELGKNVGIVWGGRTSPRPAASAPAAPSS